MAEQRGGMASDAAREVANRARSFSEQLDGREPTELLDDLRSFARRRPGMFLAGSVIAGVVVGRILRGTRDAAQGSATSGAGYDAAVTQDRPVTPVTDPSYAPGSTAAGVVRRAGRHAVGVPARHPCGDLDRVGPPVRGLLMTAYDATPGAPGQAREDRSLGQIVGDISQDLSTLMRQEMDLAKTELRQEATTAGKGIGMLAGAAITGLLMLIFLSWTLIWLLDNVMPVELAALIVAVRMGRR